MPKTCSIEGCNSPVFGKGKCKYHRMKELAATKKRKPRKPIAKRSKTRAMQERTYRILRKLYLENHRQCEARLPGCTCKATEIHHQKSRQGHLLNDVAHFLAVCRPCHTWIELNPLEAKERGFSKSRLSNE